MKQLYTLGEDFFLKKHINDYSWLEMAKRLNAQYGNDRTVTAIKKHCRDVLKITSERNGFFRKGGIPKNKRNIGAEKWFNGYLWVKVNNVKGKKGEHRAYRQNWKQKHLIAWENVYGQIPKGKQIVFLDGDKTNIDVSNLYCVDIRIIRLMNRYRWFAKNKEITLTAIKWCELFYSLKEGDGSDDNTETENAD